MDTTAKNKLRAGDGLESKSQMIHPSLPAHKKSVFADQICSIQLRRMEV